MEKLSSLCRTNIASKEDSFVGLNFTDGIPRITFPMGFNYDDSNETELRKDICLVLSCIQNNSCSKLADERDAVNSELLASNLFPFVAYKYIIDDYLINGIYSCKSKEFKSDSRGKIDWKRTIKKSTPCIQDDSFVFNNYIVQRSNVNEAAILTSIHKYCLYLSCHMLGWLYNGMKFAKPKIQVNKNMFIAVLKKAVRETFVDEKRLLFKHMISVLGGVGDGEDSQELKVGTNNFEYLWEYMLNKKFGIINKQEYFPRATWWLNNGSAPQSPLELDTIFFDNDNAYIIDAKYYKYGVTRRDKDLPCTSTIAKQVIYGEYVGKKSNLKVYNSFIMPSNNTENSLVEYLGHASVDWMDDNNEFNNIKLLVYDTKKLMENYLVSSIKDRKELIDFMEA